MTVFVKGHQRYAGDGFAHGIDAENGVPRHGFASLDIHHAIGFEMRDVTATGYQRHSSRQFALSNVACCERADLR